MCRMQWACYRQSACNHKGAAMLLPAYASMSCAHQTWGMHAMWCPGRLHASSTAAQFKAFSPNRLPGACADAAPGRKRNSASMRPRGDDGDSGDSPGGPRAMRRYSHPSGVVYCCLISPRKRTGCLPLPCGTGCRCSGSPAKYGDGRWGNGCGVDPLARCRGLVHQ